MADGTTEKPSWLQKLLSPIIDQILDRIGLEKRLDTLQAAAITEVEQLRQDAKQEIAETRDQALQMLKETLPQMAGEVSKAAVIEVFKETQTDETINRVEGAFNNILNALPFGLGGPRQ